MFQFSRNKTLKSSLYISLEERGRMGWERERKHVCWRFSYLIYPRRHRSLSLARTIVLEKVELERCYHRTGYIHERNAVLVRVVHHGPCVS